MKYPKASVAFVTWFVCMSFGCAQGQTGGEINVGDDDEGAAHGDGCRQVDRHAVGDEEEIEDAQLTASELMHLVEGKFESRMAWGGEDLLGGQVELSPESGTTSLEIDIEPISGSGELIIREQASSSGGREDAPTNGLDNESECKNAMSIDARVQIRSNNGAFDDEFIATFMSDDGVVARTTIALEPKHLAGSFDVDVSGLGDNAKSTSTLELAVAYGGIFGSVRGSVETQDGDSASNAGLTYGVFPEENPCQFGYALPKEESLYAQAQELLDEHSHFDFKWGDESESIDLALKSTLQTLCYEGSDADGPRLTATLMTEARLEDGSIDGLWSLDADLSTDEAGRLSSLRVFRNNYLAEAYSVGSFAEKTGISGVTSSADQLSFTFGYTLYSDGEPLGAGELTLLALVSADCAVEEDPMAGADSKPASGDEPGVGMGSPGCAGTSVDEIRNAQFVQVTE